MRLLPLSIIFSIEVNGVIKHPDMFHYMEPLAHCLVFLICSLLNQQTSQDTTTTVSCPQVLTSG